MRRIAIGVVVGAMVFAACGSSSKNSVASGGSTTTSAGNGSTTGNTSGGGSDPFAALTAKASTADIKITYSQNGKSPFTIIQDGKGKSAYITDNSEYITDGTTTVSCDGTTSTATCTQLPSIGGAAASPFAFFTTLLTAYTHLPQSVYGGHTSSDSIAGRDATCVTFKASDYAAFASIAAKDANSSVDICADNQTGFVLKLSQSNGSTTTDTFLATAVGTSSASDFQPPSTPQTVPAP